MKNTLITGLAELIGTAILVLMGCMGCIGSLGVVPFHLQITLTFGLAIMVVIQVSRLVESLSVTTPHYSPALVVILPPRARYD